MELEALFKRAVTPQTIFPEHEKLHVRLKNKSMSNFRHNMV